mmetsp:Transcript_13380/g.29044  ORF Transcript_13380/g.29044 Transcript_13380/m.29044 type:complete len:346 (-) Transcript_13380:84-1121(-)|eukprot:CAMPEP_0178489356 /NCGR_PEP_ID=MMETSP0696-20121128/10333_1 /TAXON_ID=265572 /ORGANISM="Extubocellulus spinifer, Strain CCMP396" /LENGTH=345 /DNA_ID=CAMNT_0020117153 /DNA_START=142 /DNA_END=1179 /DNA_ORIENTATION=-
MYICNRRALLAPSLSGGKQKAKDMLLIAALMLSTLSLVPSAEAGLPMAPSSVTMGRRSSPRWGTIGGGSGVHSARRSSSTRRDDSRPVLPKAMQGKVSSSSSSPLVLLAARRGKRTKQAVVDKDRPVVASPQSSDEPQGYVGPDGEELSLEEMRARLGPMGKTIAGAVEVGIVTAGSYLSGGILGYVGGGLFGLGALFRPADSLPPPPPSSSVTGATPPPRPTGGKPPPKGFGGEFRGRLSNVNSRAVGSAKSWAQLSAAFSGFHALTRVARGGKEDRWNGIVGSAMTGAFLNRQGGPQAMVQGASMYASFTYVLDVFFGTKGSKVGPDGTLIDDQFQYTEQELN